MVPQSSLDSDDVLASYDTFDANCVVNLTLQGSADALQVSPVGDALSAQRGGVLQWDLYALPAHGDLVIDALGGSGGRCVSACATW